MNADVHPTPADRVTNWDYEADVIVAGSGGGLVGAYTAAREGLSVMVVEATDEFGGTTAYSGGGGMWFPCNPALQRAGSDDTLDAAFAYFHAAVGDRTPVELQRTYVYGGTDLITYLEQDAHFEFDVLPWPDYYGRLPHARLDGLRHTVSKPLPAERLGELAQRIRGPLDRERLGAETPKYLVGGRALIGRLLSAITAYPNVSLHLNSPLVELVTSNDGVVGAVVEQDGRRRAIRARAGVLLAAGGFESNPALRQRFGVPGDARDTMARRAIWDWHFRQAWPPVRRSISWTRRGGRPGSLIPMGAQRSRCGSRVGSSSTRTGSGS
jgi:3-oxosteroid 1-dehydrogenase